MEKSKESTSETKAQSSRCLRLKNKGSIVYLKLLKCILNTLVLLSLCRIDTAINHGLNLLISRKSFVSRILSKRHSITYSSVLNLLDASADISYLASSQILSWNVRRCHNSDLSYLVFFLCIHQKDIVSNSYLSINYTSVDNNTLIVIVYGVENQSLKLTIWITARCRNRLNHSLKKIGYTNTFLGRY